MFLPMETSGKASPTTSGGSPWISANPGLPDTVRRPARSMHPKSITHPPGYGWNHEMTNPMKTGRQKRRKNEVSTPDDFSHSGIPPPTHPDAMRTVNNKPGILANHVNVRCMRRFLAR